MNAFVELPDHLLNAQGGCALPHLGIIHAQGADAANFLHNQLSNDFLLLPPDQARLAAFCNAKGRMQASFIGFKTSPDDVWLILRHDLLAQTLKRLRMFVLRAKVVMNDVSEQYEVRGLLGNALPAALGVSPWSLQVQPQAWTVRLYPAQGHGRALQVVPVGAAVTTAALDLHDWLLSEVLSGVADVQAATFEAFVPQMLNFESVDGVNFKKGCYPGQEVVARSQFRGTLKRRAYLVHSDAPMKAGVEVFQAEDADQPCGIVVQASASPFSGFDAIVSMQVSAFESGHLHLGAATGPTCSASAPPYPLLSDI